MYQGGLRGIILNLITKEITYKGDQTFTLYPLGDIHLGTIHCDRNHFKQTIDRIAADPNALVVGMGDYCECIVLSDPRFEPSEISPEFQGRLGDIAVAQGEQFIADILPIKDKIIGMIDGNHEFELKRRHYYDLTLSACRTLGVPYLSDTAMIRLVFRRESDTSKHVESHNVFIYAEHGAGGGGKSGGKVNSLCDLMAHFEADLYLRGHVHDKIVVPKPMLRMTGQGKAKLIQKKRFGVLTGCFYKSYEEGSSSYGQRKGYAPNEIGCPAIRIRPYTMDMQVTL
jgi:hypothetical protein